MRFDFDLTVEKNISCCWRRQNATHFDLVIFFRRRFAFKRIFKEINYSWCDCKMYFASEILTNYRKKTSRNLLSIRIWTNSVERIATFEIWQFFLHSSWKTFKRVSHMPKLFRFFCAQHSPEMTFMRTLQPEIGNWIFALFKAPHKNTLMNRPYNKSCFDQIFPSTRRTISTSNLL